MKHTLLFVDDEESILSSLARLFRREDYNILTALSGRKGLEIIKEQNISLVVSDHMMPNMTGVDFLAEVKEISPDTIRIILTGYADLDATMDAINRGEVYRFITKPWNDKELSATVSQSLDYRDLIFKNRSLTKTVSRQSNLLEKLEEKHPGITEVERTANGTIIID